MRTGSGAKRAAPPINTPAPVGGDGVEVLEQLRLPSIHVAQRVLHILINPHRSLPLLRHHVSQLLEDAAQLDNSGLHLMQRLRPAGQVGILLHHELLLLLLLLGA